MPLFTSPEAPHYLSITVGAEIDGPVHLAMSVLDERHRPVAEHRLLVDIQGNCALVGTLIESLVCGWESGANTRYLFDALARKLRVCQTQYARS
jgi:hypothetical protein